MFLSEGPGPPNARAPWNWGTGLFGSYLAGGLSGSPAN